MNANPLSRFAVRHVKELRFLGLAAALAVLLVPASAMFSAPASAADADGRFAVKSVGGTKCSQFVEVLKSKNQGQIALYVGFVAGFVSASNQLAPTTFDHASWQNLRTLTGLLSQHCDRNADLRFGAATAQMVAAMKPDRIEKRSEVVNIEHDGKSFRLYQETMRRTQAALAELGMYSGEMSGELNDAMREALNQFQTEKKLPVTGIPDQPTLYVLLGGRKQQQNQ